jgi:hypothetical protein
VVHLRYEMKLDSFNKVNYNLIYLGCFVVFFLMERSAIYITTSGSDKSLSAASFKKCCDVIWCNIISVCL